MAAPSAVRVFARQYSADADDDAWDMLNALLLEDELDWLRLTAVLKALGQDAEAEVREGAAEVLACRERLGRHKCR